MILFALQYIFWGKIVRSLQILLAEYDIFEKFRRTDGKKPKAEFGALHNTVSARMWIERTLTFYILK